jgi:hypothetical protein
MSNVTHRYDWTYMLEWYYYTHFINKPKVRDRSAAGNSSSGELGGAKPTNSHVALVPSREAGSMNELGVVRNWILRGRF